MLAREAAISLPIPQAAHLERFESVERLSEPYVITVDVICEEVEVDFITHLGEAAEITIAQDGSTLRSFSGLITEAEFLEEIEAGYRYRLVLRPWLYMLSRNLDSVIFQKKSAVEIIQAVFDKRNCQDADFSKLQKTYPSRDYCVQYRESDFAFVSRLMEQEGIYYFFDHRDGRHVMVLCDERASHPDSSYDDLQYGPSQQTTVEDRFWRWTETVASGTENKATFRDYDFTKPKTKLEGTYTLAAATFDGSTETPEDDRRISDAGSAPSGSASPPDKPEIYDFPTPGFTETDRGKTLAQTAIEAHQAERRHYRGAGDTAQLACGQLVDLHKHPLSRLNQKYLVAGLTYRAISESYVSGGDGAGAGEQPVVVEVLATPAEVQWHAPRVTPWPVARGPETATVVGPDGQTIYTDEYGRVKVQFHWDRADPSADSTCWIRVAFASADNGFGHIVLPRIGQEVVVDYLSGDPDRPLIVGSVYNADKKPPYALPDDKTKSVWRSHTIDGGSDNYNEISFEDKKGDEVFNVQAEKDRTTLVKNDETETVGGKRTTSVKLDDTLTVKEGNKSTTVEKGNMFTDVKEGNKNITLEMGSMTTDVQMGSYTLNTDLGSVSVTAMESITLTVGMSSIKIEPMQVTISAPMISIEAEIQLSMSSGCMAQLQSAIVQIN